VDAPSLLEVPVEGLPERLCIALTVLSLGDLVGANEGLTMPICQGMLDSLITVVQVSAAGQSRNGPLVPLAVAARPGESSPPLCAATASLMGQCAYSAP
jgi:hypothetical protein